MMAFSNLRTKHTSKQCKCLDFDQSRVHLGFMHLHLHVCIVYSHATKYGERFHEILVVFGKYEIVEFVD